MDVVVLLQVVAAFVPSGSGVVARPRRRGAGYECGARRGRLRP
ncbi:hypothetical protein HMPREF9056_01099 [Actinomyces sp. oral taxon 170 str. F0386]|nr:hypothetical protein HMPREF9056_01099 [Actinomyces sp. oral taxon 170 str. F0386]